MVLKVFYNLEYEIFYYFCLNFSYHSNLGILENLGGNLPEILPKIAEAKSKSADETGAKSFAKFIENLMRFVRA